VFLVQHGKTRAVAGKAAAAGARERKPRHSARAVAKKNPSKVEHGSRHLTACLLALLVCVCVAKLLAVLSSRVSCKSVRARSFINPANECSGRTNPASSCVQGLILFVFVAGHGVHLVERSFARHVSSAETEGGVHQDRCSEFSLIILFYFAFILFTNLVVLAGAGALSSSQGVVDVPQRPSAPILPRDDADPFRSSPKSGEEGTKESFSQFPVYPGQPECQIMPWLSLALFCWTTLVASC
jgi:hypothetical protein